MPEARLRRQLRRLLHAGHHIDRPGRTGLLFERFVSAERREPPDIDVDFESDRREEIIQWMYERYNRDHAALCSPSWAYARGALASQVWGESEADVEENHAETLNLIR